MDKDTEMKMAEIMSRMLNDTVSMLSDLEKALGHGIEDFENLSKILQKVKKGCNRTDA